MFLTNLKTVTAVLLLIVLGVAVGTADPTQATEQPQREPNEKNIDPITVREGVVPPRTAQREYVIQSRLLEAGADQPKVLLQLPKATVEAGQRFSIHLIDSPQNLLAKVVDDEKMKLGTFLDMRVTHLEGDKARLFCSFQRNEVETANVREIQAMGTNAQTVQVVEDSKAVKVVYQKDTKGSAQRWVEITVQEISIHKQVPLPKAGKRQS